MKIVRKDAIKFSLPTAPVAGEKHQVGLGPRNVFFTVNRQSQPSFGLGPITVPKGYTQRDVFGGGPPPPLPQ